MEEKELNLCELLKGCEGEEIFLPDEGECEIVSVKEDKIELSQESNCYVILCGDSLWMKHTGFAYAYPSKESFLANPLNACNAWMEWKEARKPKRWRAKEVEGYWWIMGDGSLMHERDLRCKIDEARYTHGNYFRTRELAEQAAEAVRETLENFHSKEYRE